MAEPEEDQVSPRLVITEPDGTFTVYLSGPLLTLGRSPDCDIWIKSPFVSKRHAVLEREENTYRYCHCGETNPSILQGLPVAERVLQDRDSLRVGPEDGPNVTILYLNPGAVETRLGGARRAARTDAPRTGVIRAPLAGLESLTIGRDPSSDLVLPSMVVSRRHAVVMRRSGRCYIRDSNSSNGTFVNGSLITEERLEDGDSIRIGPYRLVFEGDELHGFNEERTVRLDAVNIHKTIGATEILRNVSLSVYPGELVAIVGSSGSGKTTFMDALNGVRPATQGRVFVNGVDVYRRFDSVRPLLGYVPQFSILHDQLPLAHALYYTGRLRFADDVPDAEVRQKVSEVMRDLQLENRAAVPVGRLSGGQQKRASIAAELLTEPGLLFLDEPTTGLDAGLTRRLMEEFRQLADEGRTVVLVTHDTEALNLCDLILFLTAGRMVYLGPPVEAPKFFGVDDLGEVYSSVEHPDRLERFTEQCARSESYRKYVADRQSEVSKASTPAGPVVEGVTPGGGNIGLSAWRQFLVLVKRYAELMFRDPRTLVLLLIQAPFLALLLILISEPQGFRFPPGFNEGNMPEDPTIKELIVPSLPLLMAASVTWFGAINAAREIVKEVPIFRRERIAGLKVIPYLLSKVAVLGVLCVLQVILFFLVIKADTRIPDEGIVTNGDVEVFLTLLLSCLAALGLGLLISAVSPNGDRAQSLVPLVLVPQLIFARVGADVHEAVQALAYTSIARWAFQAMGTTARIDTPDFGETQEYFLVRWIGLAIITVVLVIITGVLLRRRKLA